MKTKKLIAAITLMVVVFIGCKKDDFDEIIGVCPEVISTIPTNQATGVPLNQVISVTFNEEEMDPETITNLSFTIVGPTVLQGTITYSGATAYFTPSVNLLPNTTYTGTVTTSVKDLNGNALQANYVWTFSTDIVPQVILTDPANLATGVALDKIVTATFNMPMNPSTINTTTYTIYQGETQITGVVTYNGTMATFTPTNPFLSNMVYTATVTAGAQNLQGTPMAANYVWTFTTSLVAPPHVILTDPKNHEVSVLCEKTITATFDMPMNPSTINTTTFTVTQGETPIDGVVTYVGTTAYFNPTVDLPTNTTFTGTITTGAKNVQGVALENDYTWQFCTGCTGEIPLVIFTDPANLATGVALNKTVTATFNMPMNPFTLNNNTFTITQGGSTVAGLISYDGTTVSFNPFSDLLPNTTYTGTITTGAMNFDAISLEDNYVWTFTTIPQITLTSNPLSGGNTSGAGTFEIGSAITVSASPNNDYVFTNWTEGSSIVSTNKDYAFTVSGNRNLVANFIAVTPRFNVTLTSNPIIGGITEGAGSFNSGALVTVSATPNTGYTFTNWTEGSSIVSTNKDYAFTINDNRNLVANFTSETPKFNVTLTSNPVAGGTTAGAGSFDSGASVTVSATPNTGYTFTNWTEGVNIVSTSANYSFTISANRTLVANFTAVTPKFDITLTSNPVAGGTTAGAGSFDSGASVTVSATPNNGYTFTNWTEGVNIVSTSANYTFTISGNRALVANFTAVTPKFNVTLTSNPVAGGTTSGAGSFDSGASVTVSATTNNGYTFTNWTEGVNIVSTSANYTFTISGNRTLVANFTAETAKFNVQLSALPENGGITTGAGSFDSGSSVTVNAVPSNGFTFISWKEGTIVVSIDAEYTFTLNGNRNLVANFVAETAQYNVTLRANPSNGGTTDGEGIFDAGTSVTVSAEQNTGFTFTNWTEGTTIVSSEMDYTFVIEKNMTLTANFTANPPLGPGVVDLGTAGDFVILTKAGISTTGVTSITGDIGVSPTAASSITGFGLIMDVNNQSSHTPIVNGKVYAADYSAPTPAKMTTAVSDMETAYTTANGLVTPAPIVEQSAGNLNGETLAPGLYKWATGVSITTGITLSGSATDTWVFQIAQDLTVANSTIITLAGGAKPENIVWVVAGQVVLGTNVDFSGVILSKTLISLNTGTTVNGRLLAQTAVTLNASTVVEP